MDTYISRTVQLQFNCADLYAETMFPLINYILYFIFSKQRRCFYLLPNYILYFIFFKQRRYFHLLITYILYFIFSNVRIFSCVKGF
jgi:hypothetical protein